MAVDRRFWSSWICRAIAVVIAVSLGLGGVVGFAAPASAAASGNPLAEEGGTLAGKNLSGAQLSTEEFANVDLDRTDLSKANLIGTVFSTSTLTGTNFRGADLTQTIMDQVRLIEVDFSDAVLEDAMMLRTEFRNVKIEGADFSGAILNAFQVKQLCEFAAGTNSKTGVDTRESLGCRG
jgi:uncharacterized protein YjbI with pentapeptide repeats